MYMLEIEDRSNGAATPNYLKSHVTKNKLTAKDKMNLSNNNIFILKSYLNFFKWVADKMQGFKGSYAFEPVTYFHLHNF